jgi:hypothetical protein
MTDHLRLLTRIEKSLPHPEPFPNLTLLSYWDVMNKIVQTLQSMQITPTLEHVWGHQNDHTPYDDLSLDAQLNVNADKAAGFLSIYIYPQYRPIIPRLPHN